LPRRAKRLSFRLANVFVHFLGDAGKVGAKFKLLADVSNKALRELVGKMVAAHLSPKTIVNYTQVVKLVVASAVSEDGDQIHPRVWNSAFVGIPIVDKTKQRRPTVTQKCLTPRI
jgi:hypothetical protein